jgi:hypothetical protein
MSMPSRFVIHVIAIMGAVALWAGPAGCARNSAVQVHVPVQENAAQQFAYAEELNRMSNYQLIDKDDTTRYMQERQKIRRAYAAVAEYFPADRTITPVARLMEAGFAAGLDQVERAWSPKRAREALAEYEQLLRDYPENDYVQAKALYDMGIIFKRLKEYGEAQQIFLQVRNHFADSSDPLIQELAVRANIAYNQVYLEN